jgi:hypothetical protein
MRGVRYLGMRLLGATPDCAGRARVPLKDATQRLARFFARRLPEGFLAHKQLSQTPESASKPEMAPRPTSMQFTGVPRS